MREGRCTGEDAKLLTATKQQQPKEGIVPTQLCTHTDDVVTINRRELEKCDAETERRYMATDSEAGLSKFLNNHTPVDQVVRLRVGAQGMWRRLAIGIL